MFTISDTSIDGRVLADAMRDPAAGALVTFEGRVRDHAGGRRVLRLEYEAYETLASREGARILHAVCERFDVRTARCVHRTGRLEVGEVAVWIGVLASHRAAAFGACAAIIDEIKQRVPIWKKEHYADGPSQWVSSETEAPPVRGADETGDARSAVS